MTRHINPQKVNNLQLNHKNELALLLNIYWIQKASNTISYVKYDF